MAQARTVLLVEDDEIIRQDAAESLGESGCSVREATSYDEAVSLLEEHPETSVLVTDIRLAGERSGLELARSVAERRPDICIILLSGAVRPERGEYPEDALFCTKPLAAGALPRLIEDCVNS